LSQGKAQEAVLEYLQEASELYSLTGPELENFLGAVVREPGFPKLVRLPFRSFILRLYQYEFLELRAKLNGCLLRQLEKLDSMWVIQGLIPVKGR
jgi:hypothetical protein